MAETPDVYADQFQLNLGPLGCTLNFQVSGANQWRLVFRRPLNGLRRFG